MSEYLEPAFPISSEMCGHWAGMSLRDYFAAKASATIDPPRNYMGSSENKAALTEWARRCYQMADALLEARK